MGRPVLVGVDVQPKSPNPDTDNTTDHFIVIVGAGTDSKGYYFTFYDNASLYAIFGANPDNKLYYSEAAGIITGSSKVPYAHIAPRYPYIVTQIRKNKN